MKAIRLIFLIFLCAAAAAASGCSAPRDEAAEAVKGTIMRYNQLLADGYRKLDMTAVQEVTSEEQARKLYFHMAAISEGKLKMDSTLKKIEFSLVDLSKPEMAAVSTREVWDFTHIDMMTGKRFAEERNFVYEQGYQLKKVDGRWIITDVNTVSGTSTNTVIPWPKIDRQGKRTYPAAKGASATPPGHP